MLYVLFACLDSIHDYCNKVKLIQALKYSSSCQVDLHVTPGTPNTRSPLRYGSNLEGGLYLLARYTGGSVGSPKKRSRIHKINRRKFSAVIISLLSEVLCSLVDQ